MGTICEASEESRNLNQTELERFMTKLSFYTSIVDIANLYCELVLILSKYHLKEELSFMLGLPDPLGKHIQVILKHLVL